MGWGKTSYPAVIESNAVSSQLYASGCTKPQTVHIWDLQREVCTGRIGGIDHNILKIFSASEGQPSLLVGCDSGSVLYYDLRDPRHYISISEPYDKGKLVGTALINNDVQIVCGYGNGRLKIFDIRAGALSKCKDFEGHDHVKSRMTSFASHKCGTISATSSLHSIKVWNSEGNLLSTARPHGNFLPRSAASRSSPFTPRGTCSQRAGRTAQPASTARTDVARERGREGFCTNSKGGGDKTKRQTKHVFEKTQTRGWPPCTLCAWGDR